MITNGSVNCYLIDDFHPIYDDSSKDGDGVRAIVVACDNAYWPQGNEQIHLSFLNELTIS